ncbi:MULTISPECIES: hypothetical protein [Vibrio]|jgi:NTP pyrophosphatase (non-canonical NTP hydrolase)|uniref:Uncharacterized protein n=2 Tax=Vibrio TaxID=662 RepID=A0ABW7J6L2_9VIBR|nr:MULTISPECIES: hypothetical protein [Vibrio]CAH1579057.1 conserved hypothetical protein [Vibrio owensii]MCF6452510.1 hypothetical protein [Vibrio sp. MMG023]MCX2791146.1 hypothetical protein [Vibrio sp. Sgm 5]CAD7810086.1 hypothetical protein ACOMICROBIO_NCLOACGD_02154 [Vibrio sp. B1ASS3]CAE6911223.1 hypothetical protein ACOMICROBIO_NCLOACGD_02154 [Vibrio sp. B1ASS3]
MDIRQLQAHIKEFDHDPEQKQHYFLKLIEEVGELSESIRKDATGQPTEDTIKGTIAEELYDVRVYPNILNALGSARLHWFVDAAAI